ncbi:hypothetical protein HK099_006387 [Clydaea vesicula]|uniref:Uncharacterized protein n=1 Tax=Clydaea vesicula TaxID=447962 RepID=A0AAD5XUB1_9FUNG|nr:hypothetical protein HK099_006387 [Clydaea vesicula]
MSNSSVIAPSLNTFAGNTAAPLLAFSWGAATVIALYRKYVLCPITNCNFFLIVTLRNLSLNRGTKTDIVQFLAGICLILQEVISFVDTLYTNYQPGELSNNPVLIIRITVLVPKSIQLYARILLFTLFGASLITVASATLLNISFTNCGMPLDTRLNGLGKIGFSILYFLLLVCFFIPFVKIYGQVTSAKIGTGHLKRISKTILIQISIPIVIYFIAAMVRYANLYGEYFFLGFILEDVSIFVAMSLTYSMASSGNSSTSTSSPGTSNTNYMQHNTNSANAGNYKNRW